MVHGIVLAGGLGARLNLGYNKVLAEIDGIPILAYSISNLSQSQSVDRIVVPAGNPSDDSAAGDCQAVSRMVEEYGFSKVSSVVPGGATRMESVECGLQALEPAEDDLVLIHDGARPFATPSLIEEMIAVAKRDEAAICGATPKDTIQSLDEAGRSVTTFNRSALLAIFTPFVCRWGLLRAAREKARSEGYLETPGFEDSAIVQRFGKPVSVVRSSYSNMKITTAEDLLLAPQILQQLQEENLLRPPIKQGV